MIKIIEFTLNFIDTPLFVCITQMVALTCKIYIVFSLVKYFVKEKKTHNSIFLLVLTICSAAIGDLNWVLKTLNELNILLSIEAVRTTILSVLSNTFNVILHLLLSIFIESLLPAISQPYKKYKQIRFLCAFILCGMFFSFIFTTPTLFTKVEALRLTYIFILVIGLQTLYQAGKVIISKNIPRILQHQLKIFILALFAPFLIIKLATVNPLNFAPNSSAISYPFMIFNTILLTCTIYFCTKKLIGMRFLNVKDHVETGYNINFIKDFKKTLGSLSHVSNLGELNHIVLQFFKGMFNISHEKVHLFIRNNDTEEQRKTHTDRQRIVERFFNLGTPEQQNLTNFLYQSKILIKDEIEFSAFYEEKVGYQESIAFLHAIEAELFLPIYDKNKLIAYILVDQGARPKEFYNNVERDEMLVFSAYLSSIINLVRNRNFDALVAQEKELKEELYAKHQEINQCKESIQSFFRNAHDRKIGILFYKNRRFIFGNQTAQEFLACDPNTQRGHPVTQILKKLVKNVQSYQSSQSAAYEGEAGASKIIINAIPHAEYSDIIFTLYRPDINDTIKLQENFLRDPSRWDYLLYLETTSSGQLINQLVPGHGELLLNFKIDLLKIALNKKATLLCLPEEDLRQTCELIHAISLRKELHTLKLTEPEKNNCHAITLFGLNPLLTGGIKAEPLLEKLHANGTLYIENIHFLAIETQEALADFIKYNAFHIFKSEYRVVSDVRIICSSIRDLSKLVEKGLFSATLYQELQKTVLRMPSLDTLSAQEFEILATSVMRQTIKTKSFEPLLSLNERETSKLQTQCPESLQALRKKIYALILDKSQKQQIEDSLDITPASLSSDPELTAILSMGKKALKDRKMMEYLWKTLQNQQKIASLLGVNRSSVSRRCKDYDLV